MKTELSTRRAFLKQTTGLAFSAAALPSFIPASALGKDGGVAPGRSNDATPVQKLPVLKGVHYTARTGRNGGSRGI
jgi:hypothetical protein